MPGDYPPSRGANPSEARLNPGDRPGLLVQDGRAEREGASTVAERNDDEAGAGEPPGPGDDPVAAPGTLAPVRLVALGVALVLTVAITFVKLFVAGPPSVDDLRRRAGVDSWTTLTVGVKDDQPAVAVRNPDGSWSGFDVDIAYMIAEDLGFRRSDVRFYAIESEDRARMQATDAAGHRVPVKLVVASFSITADREAMPGVTFSAPYLFTEQSVVTLAGHEPVSTLDALARRRVCSLSTSTSETAAQRAGATVLRRNRISECFTELRARRVEAVTTDAAILAGYKAQDPKGLAHWDLGLDATEAWGVNVGENAALRDLVDLTLYRSLKDPRDHRWEDAYERDLNAEAPANQPTPIAVAQQPDVPRPAVRELPWDGAYP
jgi:glutamate transport system substrate-binding protein